MIVCGNPEPVLQNRILACIGIRGGNHNEGKSFHVDVSILTDAPGPLDVQRSGNCLNLVIFEYHPPF